MIAFLVAWIIVMCDAKTTKVDKNTLMIIPLPIITFDFSFGMWYNYYRFVAGAYLFAKLKKKNGGITY